jgi:hypothetical protein
MKSTPILTGIVALALTAVLAGCGGAAPSATETPTISAPPTASATPTAVPPPATETASRPAAVFGGSCASVIAPATVKSVFGAGYSAAEWGLDDPQTAIVAQVGGLLCAVSRSKESGVNAWLAVIPAAANSESEESLECSSDPDEDLHSCWGDHYINGFRLSFHIVAVTKTASPKSEAKKIIVRFDETAATVNAVVAVPQVTAWANPVDCKQLGPRVDIAQALGTKDLKWNQDVPGRDWEWPTVVSDLWDGTFFMSCSWTAQPDPSMTGWVEVQVLGGGAWAADKVAAKDGAEEVEPGIFDRAILVSNSEPAWSTLNVFQGVNWLTVDVHMSGKFGKRLDVAAAVAAALN